MKKIIAILFIILVIIAGWLLMPQEKQQQVVSVQYCEDLGSFNNMDTIPDAEKRASLRTKYDFWESVFTEQYNDVMVYDAGTYCLLSDDSQIVTFSYWADEGRQSGQKLVLFDANNKPINELNDFNCQPSGDLGYLQYQGHTDSAVVFSCFSQNTVSRTVETYELDLRSFSATLLGVVVG